MATVLSYEQADGQVILTMDDGERIFYGDCPVAVAADMAEAKGHDVLAVREALRAEGMN